MLLLSICVYYNYTYVLILFFMYDMYTCICMYVCMYVCMLYVCMYVCMYVCLFKPAWQLPPVQFVYTSSNLKVSVQPQLIVDQCLTQKKISSVEQFSWGKRTHTQDKRKQLAPSHVSQLKIDSPAMTQPAIPVWCPCRQACLPPYTHYNQMTCIYIQLATILIGLCTDFDQTVTLVFIPDVIQHFKDGNWTNLSQTTQCILYLLFCCSLHNHSTQKGC